MYNRAVVAFGAGKYGVRFCEEVGKENILYFVDNQPKVETLEGISVKSFADYLQETSKPHIVITTLKYLKEIKSQLEKHNITDYSIYLPHKKSYFSPEILVANFYDEGEEAFTEEQWNTNLQNNGIREAINCCSDIIKTPTELFQHVEIETYNRCNGVCEFCPVSVKNESRQETKMDISLFRKIIGELEDLDYRGRLALFSNNEPFLDERIIEMHKYVREHVPNARMHLFTNGTKLTLDKFIEIIPYLDELVIDNYNQELKLIPNARAIKEYCEEHSELIKKVTIVLRKPKEILTTRGGDAPNRQQRISYVGDKCVLPFRQMIVRPDGKVSLCCNDPLGKNTLGDLKEQSLLDVWYGKQFQQVREALRGGRQNWPHCQYCDTFNID